MGSAVSFLRDDFLDGIIADAWVATATGSASVAEVSGQARFTLPSSVAGTHTARYTTRVAQDITGDWFPVNIGTMVSTSVAATAFFQYYLTSTNALQWIQLSGTLTAQTIINGVTTVRYSAAWSATTYKYLTISESGGTVTWWSSVNGTTWTSRFSMANPFAVTDLFIDFGATCGNVASPGSFRLEDVNLILPALTTTWRWIQVRRELEDREKTITTATGAANSIQGCVVTADGVDASDNPSGNVRYWAGPMDGGRVLTEQASLAAAQAMAVNMPLDGRIDLPEMVEGRVTRTYFRSMTGGTVTWRELYPRRLIQTDDLEAEIIKGMTILGHQLVADKLSAMTANIGQLVIDPDGYLWQGTGTALSPITGLKIFEVAGVGKLSTYNTGVEQITLDTDGRLKAGAGSVIIDSAGVTLLDISALILKRTTGGAVRGYIGINTIEEFQIVADQGFRVRQSLVSGNMLTVTTGGIGGLSGLNLGTALTAGAGQLAMSSVAAINGQPINNAISLNIKGTGNTSATRAMRIVDSGGTLISLDVYDDGSIATRSGIRWELGGPVTGAGTATKRVKLTVNGAVYNLLAN